MCNLKNDFQHLWKAFLYFKFCKVVWSLLRPSSIWKIKLGGSNVINAPVHMLLIACHSFVNNYYVIYFAEVQQNNLWSLCLDFIHNVCLVVSWLSEWVCLHSFIHSIRQQLYSSLTLLLFELADLPWGHRSNMWNTKSKYVLQVIVNDCDVPSSSQNCGNSWKEFSQYFTDLYTLCVIAF